MLFGALERASIVCGLSVQKGAFDLHNVVQSANDQRRKNRRWVDSPAGGRSPVDEARWPERFELWDDDGVIVADRVINESVDMMGY